MSKSCLFVAARHFYKSGLYVVEDVIEVDELDKGKIFAAAVKQDKWGGLSPAVHWWYHNQSNCIV